MVTVIIFTLSFLGLAALFVSKDREVKTGEKTLVGKILAKFDQKSESFSAALHHRSFELYRTVKYILLVHLPEKGRVKIENTKESVLNSYNKQKDVIMGKKELSNNGSSSFFLRKVSENKNGNGAKGKIEDSL